MMEVSMSRAVFMTGGGVTLGGELCTLCRTTALAAVLSSSLGLGRGRLLSEKGSWSDEAKALAARLGSGIMAEHKQVSLWLQVVSERGQCVEMSGKGGSDGALCGCGGVGGRIHARQSGHPGAEGAIALALYDHRIVLDHSPASFMMRCASPVPTSLLVCTETVITLFVSGCTS